MKSSIKIDFDHAMQPVIKVSQVDSDDVRDKLLKTFFQSLGGKSSWLRVYFDTPVGIGEQRNVYIYPVSSNDLGGLQDEVKYRIDEDSPMPQKGPAERRHIAPVDPPEIPSDHGVA